MPTSPKGVSPLGEIRSPLEDYVLGLSPSTVTPSSTPSNPRHCGGAELHAASSSACCRLPAFLALYEICDISQAPTSSSASLPDSTAAESRMVPLGLVGVGLREVADRSIEALALAEVGPDLHALA